MHSRCNADFESSCGCWCRAGSLPDENWKLLKHALCGLLCPQWKIHQLCQECYLEFWQRAVNTVYFAIAFWRSWLTPSAMCSGLWLPLNEKWHLDLIAKQHWGAGLPKTFIWSQQGLTITNQALCRWVFMQMGLFLSLGLTNSSGKEMGAGGLCPAAPFFSQMLWLYWQQLKDQNYSYSIFKMFLRMPAHPEA